MNRAVLIGAAASGAVGYAIARWLGDITNRATELEQEELCGDTAAHLLQPVAAAAS
jgi:high-affinity Fe2+/Pb2+ permease